MFSLLKFFYLLFKSFPDLLNIDRNALKGVPDQTKYLSMILLSCFWCLAFGLYVGELVFIGYNMIGHVAVLTMAFVTWWTFKSLSLKNAASPTVNYLRMPDRSSRCDEYSPLQREQMAAKLAAFAVPQSV
ncbi:hypothetical protein [Limnohabitans sp.]|uniref:hypothetical protein n=1 Tax=Limnohabitans sp. TaxID=1907725 RepID=UPI0025C37228|nr:hypothetical protein [Limnohabitans sp.]